MDPQLAPLVLAKVLVLAMVWAGAKALVVLVQAMVWGLKLVPASTREAQVVQEVVVGEVALVFQQAKELAWGMGFELAMELELGAGLKQAKELVVDVGLGQGVELGLGKVLASAKESELGKQSAPGGELGLGTVFVLDTVLALAKVLALGMGFGWDVGLERQLQTIAAMVSVAGGGLGLDGELDSGVVWEEQGGLERMAIPVRGTEFELAMELGQVVELGQGALLEGGVASGPAKAFQQGMVSGSGGVLAFQGVSASLVALVDKEQWA